MNKITIIGANSSLARNFIYSIKSKDIECFLYDIQDSFFDSNDFNYSKIDLKDLESIKHVNYDVDALYLFSGLTGAEKSIENASLFIDINEKALVYILNSIKEQNPNCHIIYPSSRLVYDDCIGEIKEDSRLKAKSVYALNKIFAENLLYIYNKMYGINYTIFRIAIPFGKLNPNAFSYGIVSKLIEQGKNGLITLYGDGLGKRTFTHIKNICQILYEALDSKFYNEIFNIGGHAYSFLYLANIIKENTNCKIEFVPWPQSSLKVEVKNGDLDSTKLSKLIDVEYIDIKHRISKLEDL